MFIPCSCDVSSSLCMTWLINKTFKKSKWLDSSSSFLLCYRKIGTSCSQTGVDVLSRPSRWPLPLRAFCRREVNTASADTCIKNVKWIFSSTPPLTHQSVLRLSQQAVFHVSNTLIRRFLCYNSGVPFHLHGFDSVNPGLLVTHTGRVGPASRGKTGESRIFEIFPMFCPPPPLTSPPGSC